VAAIEQIAQGDQVLGGLVHRALLCEMKPLVVSKGLGDGTREFSWRPMPALASTFVASKDG
jgi:hypothetical protein